MSTKKDSTLLRWQECAARCGMPLPSDFTSLSIAAASAAFVKAWRAQSSMQVMEYSAAPNPTAALIFSHGLGDTGMGWAQGFQEISAKLPHVLFVFPTARSIPVTMNGGMKMPAWFDVKGLGATNGRDLTPDGFLESVTFLEVLSAQTATKIGAIPDVVDGDAEFEAFDAAKQRIVIGGFSQGGALASYAGHATPEGSLSQTPYAGIASLSGFLTARTSFLGNKRDFTKTTPLFIGHGDKDNVISPALSTDSFDFIHERHRGAAREGTVHNIYPGMAHSSSPKEMKDLTTFLETILPPMKGGK